MPLLRIPHRTDFEQGSRVHVSLKEQFVVALRSLSVYAVKAERRTDSDTVATPTPRLSWKTSTGVGGWVQASAELRLERCAGTATATVEGAESVFLAWPFAPLAPREVTLLQVRVTGADGAVSGWSEPLRIRAGFLAEGEWRASFVGLASPERAAQPVYVRGEVDISGDVARATLYASAHGVYQTHLNGADVDDEVLKPGWTPYQFRLIHETTDVTRLLKPGLNVLDFTVAGGWYTETFGTTRFYGEQPAVAAQLVIEFEDGRVKTVASDGSWRATGEGPLRSSGIYAGETVDASVVMPDCLTWEPVRVDATDAVPEARTSPAVRRIDELAVQEIITTPAGKTVLDFGQNVVGRLRIAVEGERGRTVTLRHAEVLEDGEISTRPLRLAAATDRYTLGGGRETWEPEFTFHGFRYVEIENWPGELDPANVIAIVIHSDMERTGWFECSAPLVNQLHSNVVWGMRGNFLSLPTDCPQRDERLGWTGDIQVFSPTATYLYDCDGFLTSWLHDLWLEQRAAGGIVPPIIPNVHGPDVAPIAAWGDAATVVPWVLYERFGDLGVLADQFESMSAWVVSIIAVCGSELLWERQFQYGDWLDPDAPFDDPAKAKTDPDIVASAHLFRSADFVARAAAVLGKDLEAEHYAQIAEAARRAFVGAYITPSGRIISDTPTSYAMAIMYGIVTGTEQLRAMGERLAALVRASGYRISTGFVGTPIIQDALTMTGHLDVAERLLTQTENPSWLYPVTMGATTIWERWDSLLEDWSVNPGEMTSFNHYALGAVADWLHRVVAGLAPAEPGYRRLAIAPRPLASLQYASARHETPYGTASVAWRRNDDATITVEAKVPAGTSADVTLPGTKTRLTVGSGPHSWTVDA